ncbi:MAG: hypothetical protein ACLPUO_11155 [Streptosporangiaceae bacterium]|jgi:hypothetical protein
MPTEETRNPIARGFPGVPPGNIYLAGTRTLTTALTSLRRRSRSTLPRPPGTAYRNAQVTVKMAENLSTLSGEARTTLAALSKSPSGRGGPTRPGPRAGGRRLA